MWSCTVSYKPCLLSDPTLLFLHRVWLLPGLTPSLLAYGLYKYVHVYTISNAVCMFHCSFWIAFAFARISVTCVCVRGSAIQRPEENLPVGACLLTHLRWVLLLFISGYALLVGLWTCRDCLYLHLMFAILGWQVYVQIYMALKVLSSGLHTFPVSVFTTASPS